MGRRLAWAPEHREILQLALPAIGSGLTLLVHHWIDTYWVSHLGESAVAALAVSYFTVWIYGSVTSLLGAGLTALVARYIGAGRADGARYVASQGVRCATALALLVALVGWFLAPWVFETAGRSSAVAAAGTAYVRIYWLGGVTVLTYHAMEAVFRGHGNTRIPLGIALGGLLLNALLDPLLIFGVAGIPALGVRGAALATVLAHGAAALVAYPILRRLGFLAARRPGDEELALRPETPLSRPGRLGIDFTVFYRIGRVGLPIACSGVLFSVIYIVLSRIVEEAGGTAALAGLGVGHRGEGLAFVLCMGYSVAAASLVGRQLGARRPVDAARFAWLSVLQCALLSGVWGVILVLLDDEIAGFFLESGEARDFAVLYYQIVALSLILQAVEIVLEGAFSGAGLTVPPMVISGSLTLTRIPLATWFAFDLDLGVAGIWWVISLTGILRGIVMGAWFLRGTWKTRSV